MSGLGLTPDDLAAGGWTILVGICCAVPCALLGCYLVLRRMSLLGDAISHAVLPGIAVAFLLSGRIGVGPMFLGAMAVGVLTAFLTQALHGFGKVPEDASMGVVFTSLFAVGVLLITVAAADVDLDPGCVLYGLIEFVPLDTVTVLGRDVPRALQTMGLALVVTIGFVLLLWKELKLVAFDPMLASAMGYNATMVHYLLMAMVAGVTVASFEAVGSILVVAMLVVPAATAHLLTDRLGGMMAWSAAVGAVSAVGGYVAAVRWNTSVAGMMAVAAGLQFTLAVFLAPRHGVLSKVAHNLALSLRIACEDLVAMLYRAEEAGDASGASRAQCASAAGGRLARWLALPWLRRRGQVAFDAGGRVHLTDAGRRVAHGLVRSHRLWESYLSQHFELPPDHLHEPASRIEHYIGPALQEQLAADLDRPAVDPHGRAIPPADLDHGPPAPAHK
jgi:manganese/zinc/iron transport system permease protein